jgi:hypothetical protein
MMKRKAKRQLIGANLSFVASAITNFMHQINPNARTFTEVLTPKENQYLRLAWQKQQEVFEMLHKLAQRLLKDD